MADVDVGSETFGAFADLDFANLFLSADVLRATAWALRNDDARGRGLVSATRMLLALPWCEAPPALDAPVPEVVQQVTAMLAADLLEKPKLFRDGSGNSNVKSAGAASAKVEFFRPVEGGPPIPVDLWNQLVQAGLVGCVAADGFAAPLVSGAWAGCRPLGGRWPDDWPIACEDHD